MQKRNYYILPFLENNKSVNKFKGIASSYGLCKIKTKFNYFPQLLSLS